LRRPFDLASGGKITALQIQRHFLRQARRHRDCLPEWSDGLCDAWQDTLDRLDRGPEAVADRLDWAIKLAIFRDHAQRRAMRWPDAESGDTGDIDRATREKWAAELCELDLRYGQVDESSLFVALDEAGVLRHRIVTCAEIDRALDVPPPIGRAWIRGQVVTRLAGHDDGSVCAWDAVHDTSGLVRLNLSDPFATSEVWVPGEESADVLLSRLGRLVAAPPAPAITQSIRRLVDRLGAPRSHAPSKRTVGHALQMNNHAFVLRNTGRLEEAEWLMRAALEIELSERHDQHPKVLHRRNNLGVVLLLQGRLAEAKELVTNAWPRDGAQHDLTTARVLTTRLLIAILDVEPYTLYVGQLKAHLGIWPMPDLANVDSKWQMAFVLKRFEPRLEPEAHDLVLAIVDVLNGGSPLETLRAFPCWRDTPLEPLSTPWPAPGSRSLPSVRISHRVPSRDRVE
jgi:pup-ligase protein/tetratricopeptide repeat protein